MQPWLIISIFAALFIIIAVLLLFLRLRAAVGDSAQRQANEEASRQALIMLQQQMQELARTIDSKLSETHKTVTGQLKDQHESMRQTHEHSMKIVRDVTERLAQLGETNKQVIGFAEQLRALQDILKNPKQRGILGEYYLETVLKNVLPPGSYKMQYKIGPPPGESKDAGDLIVDAVVFVKDKIIPIDSKFSLENYNRLIETRDETERKRLEDALRQDLKTRIDETSKYINPDAGTMEFAFMFIPSEALYYDLLINKVGTLTARDLVEYAFVEKKVVIVSPTSFLAYLQTVLQGLRAMQIEESAKDIRKRVEDLGRHLMSFDTYMQKLGSNLSTTVNMYNSAYKEFGKIDKDVVRIAGGERKVEVLEIEKPGAHTA